MKKFTFIFILFSITSIGFAQNVGISSVLFTPQSPLHIYRTTNGNMLQLTNPTTTNAAGRGLFINGTGLDFSITNYENGYLRFLTNNTERMRILNTGYVGINTTAPTANFHVNGTVRFQGLTAPSTYTTALVIDVNGNVQARTLDATAFNGYTETDPLAWKLLGNNNTTAPTNAVGTLITTDNFMGTINAVDVAFGTNGYERMRIKSSADGNTIRVGVGTAYATPYPTSNTTTLLHVYDGGTGVADFGQLQIGANKTAIGTKVGEMSFHSSVNTTDRRIAGIESYLTDVIAGPNHAGDLRFFTCNNTAVVEERMRIISNGNVGIGTTAPNAKLTVVRSAAGGTEIAGAFSITWASAGSISYALTANAYKAAPEASGRSTGIIAIGGNATNQWNTGVSAVLWGTNQGAAIVAGTYNDYATYGFGSYQPQYVSPAGQWGIVSYSPVYFHRDQYVMGNVGIGTASPTYKLHVIGRIKSDGINETSDVRLKQNIQPIDNALNKILALQGVTYEWIRPEMEQGMQIGLIAQEVEKILPEIVSTDSEGFKSIQYSVLVAVLIEAVKEQQADYDALLLKVEQMESDMNAMKAMMGLDPNQPVATPQQSASK